jgi:TRAP-type C4-dicarboxylate transport system permease small subunit
VIRRALERGADMAVVAVSGVTVGILVVILGINSLEIVSRTFLSFSFQWIYETNLLLGAWMYFLGIFLVYRRGGDITMVGLANLVSPAVANVIARTIRALTGAVFLVVAWYSWKLIELQWPFRTPGVGIPRAAYTLPLLIGMIAVSLEMLRQAFVADLAETPLAKALEDDA